MSPGLEDIGESKGQVSNGYHQVAAHSCRHGPAHTPTEVTLGFDPLAVERFSLAR